MLKDHTLGDTESSDRRQESAGSRNQRKMALKIKHVYRLLIAQSSSSLSCPAICLVSIHDIPRGLFFVYIPLLQLQSTIVYLDNYVYKYNTL